MKPLNIGLLQTDGNVNKFPNFALCQISAGLKDQGHNVEMAKIGKIYDKIYLSKIFTFKEEQNLTGYKASEFLRGGTGYKIYTPHEFTSFDPDFSIYPDPKFDYTFGFLTRGCIRKCPWCVVPRKEGTLKVVREAKDFIKEAQKWNRNKITFLDNNFLAAPEGFVEQTLEEFAKTKINGKAIHLDFNQGMDARLITPKIAKLLADCCWQCKGIRLACDTSSQMPSIANAVSLIHQYRPSHNFFCYCLLQDLEETKRRVQFLRNLCPNGGFIMPYVQPYRNFESNDEPCLVHHIYSRYINDYSNKIKYPTFEDYARKRKVDLNNPENYKVRKKQVSLMEI